MTKKTAVAAPNRDARGHWLKGTSGNDLGRPRTALSELCRAQITKVQLAAGLGDIFLRRGRYKDAVVADCIRAAQLLLAYGYGPPRPDVETPDGTIRVVYEKRERHSLEITRAASGTTEGDLGEPEIQCDGVREAVGQIDAGR